MVLRRGTAGHICSQRRWRRVCVQMAAWICMQCTAMELPCACACPTHPFTHPSLPPSSSALREARRVLRPGGRFMCLEFSKVVVPGLQQLYDAYSFAVIPEIGRWVAGRAGRRAGGWVGGWVGGRAGTHCCLLICKARTPRRVFRMREGSGLGGACARLCVTPTADKH